MACVLRNTIQINLVKVSPQLRDLAVRIPEISPFTEKYGRLLNLVTTKPDEELLKMLFHIPGVPVGAYCGGIFSVIRDTHS